MSGYGQYCPLAIAAEALCERWNLLILRRLIDGCERFNEIHAGVPRISATLLTSRLAQLEKHGLVQRSKLIGSRGYSYRLTPAGRALEPITNSLAVWGQQWSRDLQDDDLDPAFLMYSMRRRINSERLPSGRTVIAFEFTGTSAISRRFWLVHDRCEADMCIKDPGHPVDLLVRSDLALFIDCWRGFRDLQREIARGAIAVDGAPGLVRHFPSWLKLSAYASVRRQREGRERQLQSSRGTTTS